MYFCNARCLCMWAVNFVTNPRRSEEQKRVPCELTMASGERRKFNDFVGVAQWSAANAFSASVLCPSAAAAAQGSRGAGEDDDM